MKFDPNKKHITSYRFEIIFPGSHMSLALENKMLLMVCPNLDFQGVILSQPSQSALQIRARWLILVTMVTGQ